MGVLRLSIDDPGSYSNPEEVVVTHMNINFDVDFFTKTFSGHVILSVYTKSKTCEQLVLDTRDLSITKVTNEADQSELSFIIDEPVHTFGSKLTIKLPKLTCEKLFIKIVYKTSSQATALQWLLPAQTAGGQYPFVFSQCQPDHCRSIIPCQDSSGIKSTYDATVTVSEEFITIMSAVKDGEPVLRKNGKKTFFFKQTVPVPAYLIAIAVGNLESRKIGPRSSVWAEPEIIDKGEYEFAETDVLLKTAEDICGPYEWEIYDILVLPPSFPFGGMENPCLTFITPTILAGDRSLVTVVAHEISHSWTGNLISAKNFEHLWLSEGFTTFIERKINGRLKSEAYRHFCAIDGLKDLKQSLKTLGETNSFTKLVVDLTGVDPNEAFSTCPYEKGHTFLFYLEELVGGSKNFEPFLRHYFEQFKNRAVDTDDFKNSFLSYFKDNEVLLSIDWDSWLYSPGMPPVIPQYDTKFQEVCTSLANRWCEWDETELCPFKSDDLKALEPQQVKEFCALLLEKPPMSINKLKRINGLYNMDCIKNCEIRFQWLRMCIQSRWLEKVDQALEFATEQGRMKYVRPIFRDLFSWDKTRDIAANVFQKNQSKMMQVLVRNLNNDFQNTVSKINIQV